MNTTITASKALGSQNANTGASDALNELVAAMPIVIFYRAVRDALRQRAHKRAVLAAFRR